MVDSHMAFGENVPAHMTKELLVLVFLIGFLAELSGTIAEIAPNGAATEESSPAGTSLPAYRFLDFSPDPDIWGANAQLRLGLRLFPGVDTALWLYYGAAWSEENYFRLGDGSLYRGDLQSAKDAGSVVASVSWARRCV